MLPLAISPAGHYFCLLKQASVQNAQIAGFSSTRYASAGSRSLPAPPLLVLLLQCRACSAHTSIQGPFFFWIVR